MFTIDNWLGSGPVPVILTVPVVKNKGVIETWVPKVILLPVGDCVNDIGDVTVTITVLDVLGTVAFRSVTFKVYVKGPVVVIGKEIGILFTIDNWLGSGPVPVILTVPVVKNKGVIETEVPKVILIPVGDCVNDTGASIAMVAILCLKELDNFSKETDPSTKSELYATVLFFRGRLLRFVVSEVMPKELSIEPSACIKEVDNFSSDTTPFSISSVYAGLLYLLARLETGGILSDDGL